MTSDLDVRQGLVDALGAIPQLTCYRWLPGQINAPAAVVSRRATRFDSTMARGSDDFEYVVSVMVSYADPEIGQRAMSAYLDTASDRSVKAAIEADPTLGGVVDFARVRDAGEESIANVGEVSYLSVDFVVEVTA